MKNKFTAFRLGEDLWEAIEKRAKLEGKSKSQVMDEVLVKDLLKDKTTTNSASPERSVDNTVGE